MWGTTAIGEIRKTIVTGIRVALAVLTLSTSASRVAAQAEVQGIDWPAVFDSLIVSIDRIHPDPYRHVGEHSYRTEAARVRAALGTGSDAQAAVALMRLVGSLEDGHTTLEPGEEAGFDQWFPVRFYRFDDGIYITAVDRTVAGLVGTRVLRIGSMKAEDAFDEAGRLMGADNDWGRLETGAIYLSSAAALVGIGSIDDPEKLPIQVETRAGELRTAVLTSHTSTSSIGWRFWGEMFGPLTASPDHMGGSYATAFDERAPIAFRSGDPTLPRHLRYRLYYWFDILPQMDALYFQWNFVQQDPDEALDQFWERMWSTFDSAGAERLVLDLRYNSGGDGSMLLPFVHDLISRRALREPGRVYVLLGRKTFSAAVMLMAELAEHLPVVFVGEPPAAAASHFGDAVTVTLPHGFRLRVSSLDWRLGHPADTLRYQPIEIPAPFSADAYFHGRDPALEAIGTGRATPLRHLLLFEGPESAKAEWERRSRLYDGYDWWRAFDEGDMNHLGYELLEAGRTDDAVTAFELTTKEHPGSWNAWDSYGDGLAEAGRVGDAIAAYERALDLNPRSEATRQKLRELSPDPAIGGESAIIGR